MPKQLTPADLQPVVDAIERHPEGVTAGALHAELGDAIGRRTLNRRLAALMADDRVRRRGKGRGALYVSPATPAAPRFETAPASGRFETPEGPVTLPLSTASSEILKYVSRPLAARRPVGFERRLLENYKPNRTAWLPDSIKAELHESGRPIAAERAAGTFARDILGRLLIDLSWSSSRLEGNTYTRLDTQRLIEFGQAAEGKNAKETQMILNHKAAIELIVEGGEEVGLNRFTLLNLHSLLSENLMADPEASGRLRRRPVEIGQSVYTPTAVPQILEECFDLLIEKAAAIHDAFEQAFFLMVQIPYLQPFEDVNKRVSRLAANVPLIGADLCPLSFVDVPEPAYVSGLLGVYEMTRVELLRDVFVWAYRRSCQKYVIVRDSLVEPDVFRMKYRTALTEVIGKIIRQQKLPTEALINELAAPLVDARDLGKFVTMARQEIARLNEGNIARHRIRLPEFRAWHSTAGTRK